MLNAIHAPLADRARTKPAWRGERDAVRDRECRDRPKQSFPALNQKDKRQDEEQMIDAEQNMLNSQPQIGH
jgi:hypothetical protein